MINSVFGDTSPPIIRIAGVTIDVKVWEVAATDIVANPVIYPKQIGGVLTRNLDLIYLP